MTTYRRRPLTAEAIQYTAETCEEVHRLYGLPHPHTDEEFQREWEEAT